MIPICQFQRILGSPERDVAFPLLPPPLWREAKGCITVCGNGAGVFIALETKRACDTTGIFSRRIQQERRLPVLDRQGKEPVCESTEFDHQYLWFPSVVCLEGRLLQQ